MDVKKRPEMATSWTTVLTTSTVSTHKKFLIVYEVRVLCDPLSIIIV